MEWVRMPKHIWQTWFNIAITKASTLKEKEIALDQCYADLAACKQSQPDNVIPDIPRPEVLRDITFQEHIQAYEEWLGLPWQQFSAIFHVVPRHRYQLMTLDDLMAPARYYAERISPVISATEPIYCTHYADGCHGLYQITKGYLKAPAFTIDSQMYGGHRFMTGLAVPSKQNQILTIYCWEPATAQFYDRNVVTQDIINLIYGG